ncbi:54S ribosomal protein img2, mitochondrial [Taxawa tesnikishii (nom. ined.)]|nr:54S ribosomal protein img2, mitochondrial [Dothideales sp. JES 119]
MSLFPPIMPFLRPLGPPKPAALRQLLRFSQSAKPREAVDPNLIASQTASPSYPPPSLRSLPRPKESRASHRTSQPTKLRNYPDRVRKPSATPAPAEPLPESQCAPHLPYFVTRTPSNELPIYHLRKRGGNLRQTRVKKISGSIDALRAELEGVLGVPTKECVINRVTNHVVIKGWHKGTIEEFLMRRKF